MRASAAAIRAALHRAPLETIDFPVQTTPDGGLRAAAFFCPPSVIGAYNRASMRKRIFKHEFLSVLFVLLVSACAPAEVPTSSTVPEASSYENGLVVSVDPIASEAGLGILRQGGNAVDAAVATGLALAVTHPTAGNLGGGGFMMIRMAETGEVHAVDYREKAPAASTPTMFLGDDGEIDRQKSGVGYLVIGVPGTVRGFWEAMDRFGALEWSEVVEPALRLARDGFVVDEVLAGSLKRQEERMERFSEFGRVYRKADGSFYEAGETMVLPDLAWTLEQIRDHGPDCFYKGEVARRLIDDIQANGGIMTPEDLANYTAPIREPIHGTYRGHDIYGMPPPSSGGTTLVQALNLLENYDLGSLERRDAGTIHLIAEAMKIGFYNRAKYLGDSDFVDVDLAMLTSKEFAGQFLDRISPGAAVPSSELGADIVTRGEGAETTHFSVVDGAGNMVANTYTLEQGYGSRVVAVGTGFLLNNEMHDFNMNPGVTDTNGLIGTAPNLVAPNKRMLSSMSPTLVLRDGQPVLATGSPGGRTIINTVLQIVINVIDFGMEAQQAVDEPRIHHQWMPDRISMERALESIEAAMQELGHQTRLVGGQGDAHTILILAGRLFPGIDHRSRGGAAGY